MPPAARISDMHVCPKVEPGPVPHVGGPTSSGEVTVIIGGMPAARVGDSLVCFGGPPDSISQGESTVIIGGKPAARLGDSTSHGGALVAGCPTVIIGSSAQAQTLIVAAQNGTPFCEECAKRANNPPAQEQPAPPSPTPQGAQAGASSVALAPLRATPNASTLLPGEGRVGTYEALRKAGKRGDNLTPHHIPPDEYMKQKVPGYTTQKGLAINMEMPVPGTGGRHRRTSSFGRSPDLTLPPRRTLARDIMDARRIYREDGLYTPAIRDSLRDLIKQNKSAWPGAFGKEKKK
jgi:uncharacterized Zn-binding protein involved in type VI secretion